MKYIKEERLEIGRRIYEGEISSYKAAEEYNICLYTARDYMRLYRDSNKLPPRGSSRQTKEITKFKAPTAPATIGDYEAMTKQELIEELVMARINEARLKKGYMVKGAGADKEYILLDNKSTK